MEVRWSQLRQGVCPEDAPRRPPPDAHRRKTICEFPSWLTKITQLTGAEMWMARVRIDLFPRRKPHGQFAQLCLGSTKTDMLQTHMRRHSQEKPYGCSRCPKTFAQQGNLRSHEKTHEKLKPFTCRLGDCGKEFSQLGNMKVRGSLHLCVARTDSILDSPKHFPQGNPRDSHCQVCWIHRHWRCPSFRS